MSRTTLLGFLAALVVSALAAGCGGDEKCSTPTLAQCQSEDWLESQCGLKHQEEMITNPEATCNVLLSDAAAAATEGIDEEEVAVPEDMGGGVAMAKVVPNPEAGLSSIDMPLTHAGQAQQTAASATEAGLSAEDQAKRDQWDANGVLVESCEEYVYEKYYGYMQFDDAMAARRTKYPYIVQAAFGQSTDPLAIGTRGVTGARLSMKEGLDMPVQAPESGYLVDIAPDNDCRMEWAKIRVDNVFWAMPGITQTPEWAQLRDAICYQMDVTRPEYVPPSPESRWQWHQTKLQAATSGGTSLVELDAVNEKTKEFQSLLAAYRTNVEIWYQPECCDSDPYGECCMSYVNPANALHAQLQALFDWAVAEGCLEPGTTRCTWSPHLFAVSLEDSFGAAMEADYQRCLKKTGDDFEAMKAYQFALPDAGNTVWPSQAECDTTWVATWPTCPVDDYTVSAGKMDVFFERAVTFGGALQDYLKATMPTELIDAQGDVKMPGDALVAHHEAGNSKFGVYYGYNLGWSLPGVEASLYDDSAALCMLGPEASARFYLGGWAFGSAHQDAVDVSYRAGLDGNVVRTLSVLGQTFWTDAVPQGLSNHSSFSASVQLVMPDVCTNESPCNDGLKVRFAVAGIPMSVTGAIAGSLGVSAELNGNKADAFTPGQEQSCWSFTVSVTPTIGLDAVVALNFLDSGALTAGLSGALTLVELGLPIYWTVRESNVIDPVDGEHLRLTVTKGADLVLTALAGTIAAFVSVDVGFFDVSYSYKLISWRGISFRMPLFQEGYEVHLNHLLYLVTP